VQVPGRVGCVTAGCFAHAHDALRLELAFPFYASRQGCTDSEVACAIEVGMGFVD